MFQRFPSVVAVMLVASVFTMVSPVRGQDETEPVKKSEMTDAQSIGYFLGVSVGQQMAQNGFLLSDIDQKSLLAGFQDGLNRKEATMSDDELRATSEKIQKLLERRLIEKGTNFLAERAKEEGVKELEKGLLYKVNTSGKGPSPTATDTVKVHYTGRLTNGTVFDSSVARGEPATFRVGGVIQGWQMALQKMKQGDKWTLYIPSDLAYGARGSQGAIGPHEVLVFDVELIEIQ